MRDDLRHWRSGQQKGGEAALGKGELELHAANCGMPSVHQEAPNNKQECITERVLPDKEMHLESQNAKRRRAMNSVNLGKSVSQDIIHFNRQSILFCSFLHA